MSVFQLTPSATATLFQLYGFQPTQESTTDVLSVPPGVVDEEDHEEDEAAKGCNNDTGNHGPAEGYAKPQNKG